MTVYVLLSVDPKNETACTLVLDSIRTGFPTAELQVTINTASPFRSYVDNAFWARLEALGAKTRISSISHHADWIRSRIQSHSPEESCILLDGDMIFWKNCEGWNIDGLYAGYHIPLIYNDFAQCVSFERLHTSFLWIPDTLRLLEAIKNHYPNATKECGAYCPVDPFMPRVGFVDGRPVFWDTCSTLYNMVGGQPFTREQLDCYEHINSASFFDVMLKRMENHIGFFMLHKEFVKKPESLRGFSRLVDDYYQQKHLQGVKMVQDRLVPLTKGS